MGYEKISWTEASSVKSEVVSCVHEKSMICIICITLKILNNDKYVEQAVAELGQA